MEQELALRIKQLVEDGELIDVLTRLMIEEHDAFVSLKEIIDDMI